MFVDNWYLILNGIEPEMLTVTQSTPIRDYTVQVQNKANLTPNNLYIFNQIKDVIFNNPATIIKWKDGTKTVVKCADGDVYNKETGFALCIIKKMYGNDNSYQRLFKRWIKEDE